MSYGPPGVAPQYETLEFGGRPPRRRGPSPWLIGGIVGVGVYDLLIKPVITARTRALEEQEKGPATEEP